MAQNLKIYVSQQSFDDEDEYEIVSSNIDLLNALLNEYLNEDEIHPASLQSYYVDYYHAQVHNGGFSPICLQHRCERTDFRAGGAGLGRNGRRAKSEFVPPRHKQPATV